MPDIATLATFLVALFVLNITPGPDMMLVLARGIGQGRKTALLTVIGMIFVSGIVQVGLLVLGVASLLNAYPTSLVALQWCGAAYLIYLGLRMLRESIRKEKKNTITIKPVSSWRVIREGTINNLTNPKSLLFMFAFLPQFVDPQAGPIWVQLIILGSIQKLAGLLSLGTVAFASGSVGQWLHRWPNALVWQKRFTGTILLGLGVRLLLSDLSSIGSARS